MLMEEWFPWEQLPEESGPAWAAFVVYRDLGPSRTLAKAAETLDKHPTTLSEFGRKYQWEPRVRAWDAYVDRARRAAYLELQIKTVDQHLEDAKIMRREAMDYLKWIDVSGVKPLDALRFMLAAIKTEQAALGLPSAPPENPNANADPIDVYFDALGERELLKQTKAAVPVLEQKQKQLAKGEHHAEQHPKPAKRNRASRKTKG